VLGLISVSCGRGLACCSAAYAQDQPPRPRADIRPQCTIRPNGTAMDAAQAMASAMDGAGGGISSSEQIAALQDAAAAGDPMAQWQLGLMYESGEGVAQDKARPSLFRADRRPARRRGAARHRVDIVRIPSSAGRVYRMDCRKPHRQDETSRSSC